MVFREKHNATTAKISLPHTLEVDLEIIPGSDRQWIIIPSANEKTVGTAAGASVANDVFRLVECKRYSSESKADNILALSDRQLFRLQPIKVGTFSLELHYKSLWETEYAKKFVLHLEVFSP